MALQSKKLLLRAETTIIGILVIGGMLLFLPKWCFQVFLILVGLISVREAGRLAKGFGFDMLWLPVLVTVVLGIGSVYIPQIDLAMLFFVVFALSVLLAMKPPSDMKKTLPSAGVTLVIASYIACALIALSQLFALDQTLESGRDAGRVLVCFCILMVWAGDSCAYLVGSMIGKHKISPVVSPNKSWEGFIANVVGNFLLVFVFSRTLLKELDITGVLILTATFGLLGFFGDLVESSWKRGSQIKDSGSLLPGHGGLLDRLDSFFLTAPICYFYMTRFVL